MKRPLAVKGFPIFSALLLISIALMLAVFSRHSTLVEKNYTWTIYAPLTKFVTAFTALFAVSISEIALYLGLLGFLLLLTIGLRRRTWKWSLTWAMRGIAVVVSWFYLAWGCNYFRLPLAEQLQLTAQDAAADSTALRENLLWSMATTNAAWREIPARDLNWWDEEIERSYRQVCDTLHIALMPGRRRPKFLLLPALFNYTLTSGMFGPFFHEIHLNSELLPVEMPFVLAHEKAHQMGFASESEANFLAALACWMSADSSIQYSGSFAILGHFWTQAASFSDRDSLRQSIRPEVRADFAAVRQRYQKYEGALSEVSHKSYDAYLRVNRVEGGVRNYSEVVDLIVRWRAKQAHSRP